MKKLMFLGLCAFVMAIAKPAIAQIPDATVLMQRQSDMPLEVDLSKELTTPIHMDDGFSCLFKDLFTGAQIHSKMEAFQEWVVMQDQPMEYRELMKITDNKVIDISTNMADIRKRIAYVLQFPPKDNVIFGFIKNCEGPEMVVTLDFSPEDGFPNLQLKPIDHNCADKNTRIIAHL